MSNLDKLMKKSFEDHFLGGANIQPLVKKLKTEPSKNTADVLLTIFSKKYSYLNIYKKDASDNHSF